MLVTDTGDSMYWSPFSPIFAVKSIFLVYQGFFKLNILQKAHKNDNEDPHILIRAFALTARIGILLKTGAQWKLSPKQ